MTGETLRNAILNGEKVYGTLAVSGSPHFFAAMRNLPIDFIFIDMEHITYNVETLSWMCHAYRAANIAPIVRILSPDPYLASRALDYGAQGILAPYVEQVEDVVNLVGAVKYKPIKGEKLKQILQNRSSITPKLKAKLDETNKDHVLFINIESPTGIDHLDAFLSIEGLDGVIIGPHDLSFSHEIPEEYTTETYKGLIARIIEKTRSHGLGAGCHSGFSHSLELQKTWVELGANIVLHGSDMTFFQEKAMDDLSKLRGITKTGKKPDISM